MGGNEGAVGRGEEAWGGKGGGWVGDRLGVQGERGER